MPPITGRRLVGFLGVGRGEGWVTDVEDAPGCERGVRKGDAVGD